MVSVGSSHDDLTAEYASIPAEMRAVAAALGGRDLRDVTVDAVLANIPKLRESAGERAILRALHYFDENARVERMAAALDADDLPRFLREIIASGESSWKLLQNIYVNGGDESLALALELSRRILEGKGAWRVHGGGFAGTILAFVPHGLLDEYTAKMRNAFGPGACSVLGIRARGAGEVLINN